MKRYLAWLILAGAIGLPAQQSTVNTVFPAVVMTATSQTSAGVQLLSSYSAATVNVTGVSLSTATIAVYGCSLASCTSAQYQPLALEVCSSPGTFASTQTVTANACLQFNPANLTSVEFVTSGTFTATSITLTLTASPNAQIGRSSGGGSGTFNALTGDASSTSTGGATTVKGINGTLLSSLATGLVKNTTASGVPSIAAAGTDYLAPTGSATGLSKASSAAFGVSECDNSTITCPGGVFTAVGSGSGTVTSVSVTTANGVSGTVATATSTPAISLTLGAITPTSTNGVSAATMAFVDPTSSVQTQLNAKAPIASPTFTGTPAGPTATLGTNTTQLATTAFVLANGGGAPVTCANTNNYPCLNTSNVFTGTTNTFNAIAATTVTASGAVTATGDGVHAGILGLVGNTTNPTCPTNQFCWFGFSSASATAYGFQPNSTAPSGTQLVTVGTPVSGASPFNYVTTLPTASEPAHTGDATNTAGSLAMTVVKVDGVAYSASPSTNTVPVVTGSNVVTYEAMPLTAVAVQAADTIDMNATGGSASPTAVAMPACTSGADLYNTAIHSWSCVTTGGGGGLPTGTTGQTVYYASGGTTATATSATTTTSASSGFNYGIGNTSPIGTLDVGGPIYQEVPYTGNVTLGASLSATATSATISGGSALNPNGGVVLIGVGNGSNNQEYICYSAATSTTMTIGGGNCGTPVTTAGRSYWNTTAAIHNSSDQVVMVLAENVASISSTPYWVQLGNNAAGAFAFGSAPPSVFGNRFGTVFGNTPYFLSSPAFCLSNNPADGNGGFCASLVNGSFEWANTAANAALVTAGTNLDYAIATQGITTVTAITNAFTPAFPTNGTTAAAGAGGVLSSHCTIIWNQATSGTVQFSIKASAAAGHIWIKEQDSPGAYLAPTYTTLTTSTSVTATSGTVTPSAFGTTYASDLWIAMDPGTTNSPSIQLYAAASANTLTIEPGTGCTGWQ